MAVEAMARPLSSWADDASLLELLLGPLVLLFVGLGLLILVATPVVAAVVAVRRRRAERRRASERAQYAVRPSPHPRLWDLAGPEAEARGEHPPDSLPRRALGWTRPR